MTVCWNIKNVFILLSWFSNELLRSINNLKQELWYTIWLSLYIYILHIYIYIYIYIYSNHLPNVCHLEGNKFEYLQIHLIEQVSVNNSKNIDKILWEREKYWQAQPFTLTHGLNSPNEWYAQNRRGYRK